MNDANLDGTFDAGDDTGNAAIDATLDKFAAANRDNPAVSSALERAAAEIKTRPEEFLEADGAIRKDALSELLARELASAGPITIPDLLGANEAEHKRYPNLGAMGDLDLVALTFIVLLEAAKAAQEDLKAIIAAVKKLNEEKEGWRQVAKTLNAMANGTAPQHDVDDAKDMVKHTLDSLSELGEMESLRLQMAMDRLAKLMSTLSNLLKKASETASGITQNIK